MMRVDDARSWAGGAFIAIYQAIGQSKTGYFCPLGQSMTIDYASADRRIPEKHAELKREYNFSELSEGDICSSIRSYAKFVTKAVTYRNESRFDEAFLHYVIAIDLLFGEKESSMQAVARRVAAISSGGVQQLYHKIFEQVRALYNYRSRYVHEGIGILPVEIDKIEPIINCVLLCLFKLQANPDNRHAGAFERWLKSLDFIAAAMDVGKAVEAVDLLGCAIDQKVDNT